MGTAGIANCANNGAFRSELILRCAYICACAMPQLETNRNKVAAQLERDGWVGRHGGDHDVYKHPARPGRIIVPRHRTLSPGGARTIAKVAGWQA